MDTSITTVDGTAAASHRVEHVDADDDVTGPVPGDVRRGAEEGDQHVGLLVVGARALSAARSGGRVAEREGAQFNVRGEAGGGS